MTATLWIVVSFATGLAVGIALMFNHVRMLRNFEKRYKEAKADNQRMSQIIEHALPRDPDSPLWGNPNDHS